MAPSEIWNHPDPQATLIPIIRSHLPYSIPLLRRIQHNFAYPSPTAHVLATFPPTRGTSSPSSPWTALIIDLFRGRETQIYIYSSLEKDATTPPPASGNFVSKFTASSEQQAEARAQLVALLSYIKTNLLPEYIASSQAATDPLSPNVTATTSPLNPAKIPAPPPTAFLFGSIHTGLLTLLTASDNYSDPSTIPGVRIIRRDDPPYIKYLCRPEIYKPSAAEGQGEDGTVNALPQGYRFQDRQGRFGVLPHQFDLVSSRTHIPRSRTSLSKMPGVAIYYDGGDGSQGDEEMPIAWAFLGFDGSLATLHVEPEHRGRGLAVQLSKETMRSRLAEGGIFRPQGEMEEAWGYSDVATQNTASRRVMEKIGGEMAWTNSWAVVELCD